MKKKLVFAVLFTAITSVCGFIAIPVGVSPVPIVLQNMAVVINGIILGPFIGTLSTVFFVVLGLIGFPVFSGGTSGLAKLAGPTGGFIIGYIFATFTVGILMGRPAIGRKDSKLKILIAVIASFVVMYIPGVFHFIKTLDKTFAEAMTLCVIPYIPGDVLKIIACVLMAKRLRKISAQHIFTD